jgi:hypothetical protein
LAAWIIGVRDVFPVGYFALCSLCFGLDGTYYLSFLPANVMVLRITDTFSSPLEDVFVCQYCQPDYFGV